MDKFTWYTLPVIRSPNTTGLGMGLTHDKKRKIVLKNCSVNSIPTIHAGEELMNNVTKQADQLTADHLASWRAHKRAPLLRRLL